MDAIRSNGSKWNYNRSIRAVKTDILREELLVKMSLTNSLPTFDSILTRLLSIISDTDASINQLLDVVKCDLAISAKIIRIANSAFYHRGSMIVDLKRAMMRIGLTELKDIIVCVAFLKDITNQWGLNLHDLEGLWVHSLAVSNAVKILNRRAVEHPGKAATVSILHDLGKTILYAYGDKYGTLIEKAMRDRIDICDLEKETFGIDHQEIGYQLSVNWKMPEEVCWVVGNHHGAREADGLIHLVYTADSFLDDRAVDLGEDGIMLEREADFIQNETTRMSELIGKT